MRIWLAQWFRRVAQRLDPQEGIYPTPVAEAADALVYQAERLGDNSDFKRRWVLNRLRQMFPATRHRELSLEIEWAVRRLKR